MSFVHGLGYNSDNLRGSQWKESSQMTTQAWVNIQTGNNYPSNQMVDLGTCHKTCKFPQGYI